MFDKLKSAVGDGALKKVADEIGPVVIEKLSAILHLTPTEVQDDAVYKSKIINPTLLAVGAATSGVTALIPNFEDRFTRAMLHLRDELVVIDPAKSTVGLAPDFTNRLPAALLSGLKVAAS